MMSCRDRGQIRSGVGLVWLVCDPGCGLFVCVTELQLRSKGDLTSLVSEASVYESQAKDYSMVQYSVDG